MRDFIFVHPTFSYDSYTDYRRLVAASGFPVCNQDQMEAGKKCTYIVTPLNGDVEAALNARPKDKRDCKVIWWFLERPGPHGGAAFEYNLKQKLNNMVDEVWISDRAMWSKYKAAGNVNFVPVGGDACLGSRDIKQKIYDYTHMSYVYGRREKIFNRIRNFSCGPNGWGDARHNTLLQSKLLINTHQDDDKWGEPLRFALCAAYALPMLSETCEDPYPYVDGADFLGASPLDLPALVEKVMQDGPEKYRPYGERMYEKATKQFRFINIVKDMATK